MKYFVFATAFFIFFIMHGAWGVDISMAACNTNAIPINIFGTHDLNQFYHQSLIEILLASFFYVLYLIEFIFKHKEVT